ncbi:Uncharacterized protein CTYZ_00000143 [Cryptosporidium tyzzeri]|nr:Uncharacterized protein CTYZ_00000143 [Cryptosporidium tyzzeri]
MCTQNNSSHVSQGNNFQLSNHQSRQYQQNNTNEMMMNSSYNKNQELGNFGSNGEGSMGVSIGSSNDHGNNLGNSQHLYSGNNNNFEMRNIGIVVANNSHPSSSSNVHSQQYQYSKQQQQHTQYQKHQHQQQHHQQQHQQFYNQIQQNQHDQNQYQHQQQRYSQNQNVLHYNSNNVNIRSNHIINGGNNGLIEATGTGTGTVQTGLNEPDGNLQGGNLTGRIQTTNIRRNPTLVDNNHHDQYHHTLAPGELAPAGLPSYIVQNFQGQKGGIMNNGYNGEVSNSVGSQYYGGQYNHILGHNQMSMEGGVQGMGYRGGIGMQDQPNQQGQMHPGGNHITEMRGLDYNYGNYTQ